MNWTDFIRRAAADEPSFRFERINRPVPDDPSQYRVNGEHKTRDEVREIVFLRLRIWTTPQHPRPPELEVEAGEIEAGMYEHLH